MKRKFFTLLALILFCTTMSRAGTVLLLTSPTWGTVLQPSSGTTQYALSTSTGLVTVVSGSGLALGIGLAGSYLLTGLAFHSVSYSISIGSFTGTGVSVVTPYINGTSSSGSGSLSILGTLTVNVGGVLAVTSAATAGIHTATVTVTVNFP